MIKQWGKVVQLPSVAIWLGSVAATATSMHTCAAIATMRLATKSRMSMKVL